MADWGPAEYHSGFRVGGRETNRTVPRGCPVHLYDARYEDIVQDARIILACTMSVGETRISVSLLTVELQPPGNRTRLTFTEQIAGRMEITNTAPPSKITIELDFLKPMEGHKVAEFTLAGKGDNTEIPWAMFGPCPYISKLIGIFPNMDTIIGGNFETGLTNLKTLAEKQSHNP